MMSDNLSLCAANLAKSDEFYTRYEDISNELNHYEKHFYNKTVLCNCDDPFNSNFCVFFLHNFKRFGLKRLICTSYSENGIGMVADISSVADTDIDSLLKGRVKQLSGNGDFRSEECIGYLKLADIVVTNPPFSLFREYVAQLIEYGKRFIIVGNKNAITYKDIFPFIRNNKIWLGVGFAGGNAYFKIPPQSERKWSQGVYNSSDETVKFRNVGWFTNIEHSKRNEELPLHKEYHGNESLYPRYDNYDAINVDRVADIPCDYLGVMGVPITYLDKYNPEQFEIVGLAAGNIKGLEGIKLLSGKSGPYINGKLRYGRIFIKKVVH